MFRKIGEYASGVGYVKLAIYAALAVLGSWGAYTVYYRMFVLPEKFEDQKVDAVVNDELLKGDVKIQGQVTDKVIEYRDRVQVVERTVNRGTETIYAQESNDDMSPDVAGAIRSSLCQLHNDLCGVDRRGTEPDTMQQVHSSELEGTN